MRSLVRTRTGFGVVRSMRWVWWCTVSECAVQVKFWTANSLHRVATRECDVLRLRFRRRKIPVDGDSKCRRLSRAQSVHSSCSSSKCIRPWPTFIRADKKVASAHATVCMVMCIVSSVYYLLRCVHTYTRKQKLHRSHAPLNCHVTAHARAPHTTSQILYALELFTRM